MDSQKYISAYQNDGLNHTFAMLRFSGEVSGLYSTAKVVNLEQRLSSDRDG